jgi:hypothetical protein
MAILLICSCGALLTGGCGGSATISYSATLTGVVYAPDGVTRVADALVYVPKGRAASRDLPEETITWTTSGTDGSFVLGNVPAGTTTVKILKDEWSQSFEIDVPSGESIEVSKETTTLSIAGDLGAPPGSPFTEDDSLDSPPGSPQRDGIEDSLDLPPPPPSL